MNTTATTQHYQETSTKFCHPSNHVSYNDEALVWRSFKDGDIAALECIYKENFEALYAYGCKFTDDQLLVEDCIHDLFINISTKKSNLAETTSVRYYLMTALRRMIFYKKNAHTHHVEILKKNTSLLFYEETNAEIKICNKEKNETLKRIMKHYVLELPKRQKQAIYLRFFENLEYDQIAHIMHINTNSVYKVIYKGLKKIKQNTSKRDLNFFTTFTDIS